MTNARKSREKHRMEESKIIDEQFEQERIEAMRANWEVYSCSGNQNHLPSCEGCEVKKLLPIEIEIIKEQMRWEELGMTPLGSPPQVPQIPGIPTDSFKLSIAVSALNKMIVEKLGLDEEELNNKYRELLLERLVTIREANEEEMIAAQRRQEIAVAGAGIRPQLIVPEHIKRKMH